MILNREISTRKDLFRSLKIEIAFFETKQIQKLFNSSRRCYRYQGLIQCACVMCRHVRKENFRRLTCSLSTHANSECNSDLK